MATWSWSSYACINCMPIKSEPDLNVCANEWIWLTFKSVALQLDDLNRRSVFQNLIEHKGMNLTKLRRFNFPHNSFDIVHSQLVAGDLGLPSCFCLRNSPIFSGGINANRWPTYLRDLFQATRPGGWCQMVELYLQCQSDNGTLTESIVALI